MLVLSRRLHEKIVLPGVPATIEVVGVKSNTVRLGVVAPPEVVVLREEVADRGERAEPAATAPAPTDVSRLVANRLKVAGIGLSLLRGQVLAGRPEEALTLVDRLAEDLQLLHRRLTAGQEGPLPPPAPHAATPPRALLVEDNANERELLARFLRMGGFEVDTAGDGADALDYLHGGGRPDVVLLDMGLPRLDGPTTLREIRRDGVLANLKVFAVSGHAPEEFNFGPAGVDRWFHKPVDPGRLLDDLRRELERTSA